MLYIRPLLLLLITVCIAHVVGRCGEDRTVPVSGGNEKTRCDGRCDEDGTVPVGGSNVKTGGGCDEETSGASGGELSGKSGVGSDSASVKVSGKVVRVSRSASSGRSSGASRGGASGGASGGGSSGASGRGSTGASGGRSSGTSGGGSNGGASGGISSGASGGGSSGASGRGSTGASGGRSSGTSGGGSNGGASGGISSGASGGGSSGASGRGSTGASGGRSSGTSGGGSNGGASGGRSSGASGGGSSGASGRGSSGGSSGRLRGTSGGGLSGASGGGSSGASGRGSTGASSGRSGGTSGGGSNGGASGGRSSGASGGGSSGASGRWSTGASGGRSSGTSGGGSNGVASSRGSSGASGGGSSGASDRGSTGASGGRSIGTSGGGSNGASGGGSNGASGRGSNGGASGGGSSSASGGRSTGASGRGSSGGASGGGSSGTSDGGSSGASSGGSNGGASDGRSTGASGRGSSGGALGGGSSGGVSGEGSRGASGGRSNGASGGGSSGASGGGSSGGASGGGSSSTSGGGSNGAASGEGSSGASGRGSSEGASGGGSRGGVSGEGSRGASGGRSSGASGGRSSGASGGGSSGASGGRSSGGASGGGSSDASGRGSTGAFGGRSSGTSGGGSSGGVSGEGSRGASGGRSSAASGGRSSGASGGGSSGVASGGGSSGTSGGVSNGAASGEGSNGASGRGSSGGASGGGSSGGVSGEVSRGALGGRSSGASGGQSSGASGGGSSGASGGRSSGGASGGGSSGASGRGSTGAFGGRSSGASGGGSNGSASGGGSNGASGGGSSGASGRGSTGTSGGRSIGTSGGGSSGASGGGSNGGASAGGSSSASGGRSTGASGRGSSGGASGGGSSGTSDGGSSGASSGGSNGGASDGRSSGASGRVSSGGPSGEGPRGTSGGSSGASGGGSSSASGGWSSGGASGGGSSRGALGGESSGASGRGSISASVGGLSGASGRETMSASGGGSSGASGGGSSGGAWSGGSSGASGGLNDTSGALNDTSGGVSGGGWWGSRSTGTLGGGSSGASGGGSNGTSGGASGGGWWASRSSGTSGGASSGASGGRSSGASNGGSSGASGGGSSADSGGGLSGASGGALGEGLWGSRSNGTSGGASGGGLWGASSGASVGGLSGASGGESSSVSGGGSSGASGGGSSGESGGGSRGASGGRWSGTLGRTSEGGYSMNQYEYIGLENEGKIHNNAFEASSYVGEHKPERARLNGDTSWHNDPDNDPNPWISVDLGRRENVYGIITQGDGTRTVVPVGWVTAFILRLSNDFGFSESVFAFDANGNETFRSDVTTRYDRKINMFQNGITARYVKLHVSQCSDGGCFLRMELLTRHSDECSETCRNVGLSDKHEIRDGAFDASSHNGGQSEPKRARLGGSKSWHNDPDNDPNPWISVAFGRTVNISGIITQGDGTQDSDRDGWVTEFALEFSDHGDFSEPTFAVAANGSQTFFANPSSRNDRVGNMFQHNVTARHVKLHVRACSEMGCYLRMDFVECGSFMAECLTAKRCGYVGISNDDVINNIAFRASSNDGEQTVPSRARLDGNTSWHSPPDDSSPWIIVDLGRIETVFGIITQGDGTHQANRDGWVTEFELEFSQYYYFNESVYAFNEFGSQIFFANHSRYESVLNMFQHNVTADYVKLHIKACSDVGCFLRMELVICTGTGAATRYGQTFRSVSRVVTSRLTGNVTDVRLAGEVLREETAESQNTTDRRRPTRPTLRPRATPRGGNFANITRNQHESTDTIMETKTPISTTVLMTTEPQTTTPNNVFADVENLLDDSPASELLNAATSMINSGPEKTYNRREVNVLNKLLRRVSLKNSSSVEEYRNNTRAVLKITKVLFEPKQKLVVAEKLNVASMMEDILSSSAESIPTGESVVIKEDNMVAAMYHVNSINQIADMVFDVVIPEENNETRNSIRPTYYLRVVIPDGVEYEEGSFGMTIIYIADEQSATEHSEEEDNDATIASGIMVCTLTSGSTKVQIGVNFTLPVNTSGINDGKDRVVIPKKIKFRKATERKTEKECVFWNNDLELWSEYGCQKVASGEDTVSCECNHTTSFAVLVQVNEREISTIHDTILTIISYAGGAVSIASLVLVIGLTFYLKELEKSDHVLIMKNLMITLALGQTIFLVGVDRTESMIVCKGVALILHYLFLAMFMWMFNEGLYLYRRLWLVFGINSTSSREYKYTGWAIPGVYVAICFVVRFSEYGTEESCWLSQENGLVWTFVGPVLVIIVMNLVLLLLVARIIIKASKEVGSTYDRVKNNTRKSILVLPVLGLTWAFGVLIIEPVIIPFTYLFVIFVSFQGLVVAMYCFTSTEVQTAWINKRAENAPIKQATWATKRTNSVSSLHGMPSYQGDTFYEDFGKIVPYRLQFGYRPNSADSMSKKRAPKRIDRELCQNKEMRSPPPSYEDTVKAMVPEEAK